MAGLPKISNTTLNAYNDNFNYITQENNNVYTKGQGITYNVASTTTKKYGTILELNIEALQMKPLELQKNYWISVMTTTPLQINQFVEYKGKKFSIENEFKASNFYIYHCCENKNI